MAHKEKSGLVFIRKPPCSDHLVVHRCRDNRIVILECEVHDKTVASGVCYDNRFISVVTIENRKMVYLPRGRV